MKRSVVLFRRRRAAGGDSQAPVVSNVLVGTEVDAGYTGSGDVPVSFDLSDNVQANNTVYYVIYPSGDTPPTGPETKAGHVSGGTAADASGSIVTAPGSGVTNTDAIPDGINGTYRIRMVAEDGSGNLGDPVSSNPVAINTVVLSRTHLGRHETSTNDGTTGRYTFSGVTLGVGQIVAIVQWASNAALTTTSVTIDGTGAALLNDGVDDAEAIRSNIAYSGIYDAACTSASGNVVVQLSGDILSHGLVVDLYLVTGTYTTTDTAIQATSAPAVPYQASVDVNTSANGIVFAGQAAHTSNTTPLECLAGVTQDGAATSRPGSNRFVCGSIDGVGAASSRTVTLGQDTDTALIFHITTVAASLEPA